MNSDLPAYLRAAGATPFAWGACDCCTWACDWALRVAGVDPALEWRGACRTARDAERILREGGGLLALARRGCAAVGLAETQDPLPGDIGVVLAPMGEAMAIRTPLGWAIKARRGFGVAEHPRLAAWRLEARAHG